jgi:alpha-beta hydrolase superfamily lysophospholipase
MLIIHGAGGHVGALWPFTAVTGADEVEILALDLPLYGRTESPHPAQVRYRDWVGLLSDFVVDEQRTDPRPLILFGASMGGTLPVRCRSARRRWTGTTRIPVRLVHVRTPNQRAR